MGYDHRIGKDFLKPGPGWGGSCFPKDTKALVRIAEDAGYDFNLLRGVVAVNDEQRQRIIQKVVDSVGGDVAGATVAVWGLTFKANTDDMRDSPAVAIVRQLVDMSAKVRAFDPTTVGRTIEGIEVGEDALSVCDGADVLVVLTEWDQFRWIDLEEVGARLATRTIVDARNLLDAPTARRLGFGYQGVGR
jgi:UDPglucose 6-dehydrogenase